MTWLPGFYTIFRAPSSVRSSDLILQVTMRKNQSPKDIGAVVKDRLLPLWGGIEGTSYPVARGSEEIPGGGHPSRRPHRRMSMAPKRRGEKRGIGQLQGQGMVE